MTENRKIFYKGIVVGIIAIVWINVVFNGAMSAYRRFVVKEITVYEKVDLIFAILDKTYVGEVDKKDIENGLFTGMLYGVGDRYTSYMSSEDFSKFMQTREGTYVGIGTVVTPGDDGSVIIVSPFYGSPAYNAGLLPGDSIREIDGIDIRDQSLTASIDMIQGPVGTTVSLNVYRQLEDRSFDVDIVREQIVTPTVSYEMLEDNIGFIRITAFERITYDQFMEAYESLVEQGMEGLIIDVRNNPGGLLDVVVDITNELVPEGIIVYTEDTNGNRRVQYSDDKQIEVPLAILINGNSASASEVLAGAIKDHGVGVLVGEQSFGKGLVQDVFPLPDGSAIKVTIATYYTPNGISIHGEGLTPTHIVPMDASLSARINTLSFEEDIQLQKAYEVVYDQITN